MVAVEARAQCAIFEACTANVLMYSEKHELWRRPKFSADVIKNMNKELRECRMYEANKCHEILEQERVFQFDLLSSPKHLVF